MNKPGSDKGDVARVFSVIEGLILRHRLLKALLDGESQENKHLKEQYGENAVKMGNDIIDIYLCLRTIVKRYMN